MAALSSTLGCGDVPGTEAARVGADGEPAGVNGTSRFRAGGPDLSGRDGPSTQDASVAGVGAEPSPRIRYTLNDGWRFRQGSALGAAAVGHDDRAWSPVTLPHTWNAEDAFEEDRDYRRGVGWYRRRVNLEPRWTDRRVFLHFEGANQVVDVFVNGHRAGHHEGGYTAFAFDVTDLVRFDRENVLAVRVDNSHDPAVPPLDADFTFYGGIYRDVWLVVTDAVHIEVLDHASPGVFIDTPEVSEREARVRVRGRAVNDGTVPKTIEVVSLVLDHRGRSVAELRTPLTLPSDTAAHFEQTSAVIPGPRLWSPDSPYLYRVLVEIREGERTLDRVESPLGFRWFDIDPDSGVWLNGERISLKGTNRHQDRAGYGNALPDRAHREDVQLIKETGFNFLRLAHYPQDPSVLEEADRLGLLVWEEIPIVNRITTSDEFAGNAETMLVEMIRQHYNHPSILFWGYMNEVLLRPPDPEPPGYRERVVELARRLEARAQAEDATRFTAMAHSRGEIDNGTGLQDVTDVMGMNLYFGWYYGRLETLGAFLDSLHLRHPDRPLIISEYGAGSDERVHSDAPEAFDFSVEYQQRFHESQLQQIRASPYLLGSAVWNQFDFGSKNRHDTRPDINQKGLFRLDREPKDVASYYRALLIDEPVLHIAVRESARRAGSRPADRTQPVKVYTNLEEIQLFHAGGSVGSRPVVGGHAVWSVPLRPGANPLRAQGVTAGGELVEDAFSVHYADAAPLFTDSAGDMVTLAVNAGGDYDYVDALGTTWLADRTYERGGWGQEGGETARTHHRIYGTDDEPLFQATLEGTTVYRFDVTDGLHEVRLAVVEIRHDEPGRRIFGVRVNGDPVFTTLDPAGKYGRYVAIERSVRVRAADGNGIVVRLDARAGQPTISGIRVTRLSR